MYHIPTLKVPARVVLYVLSFGGFLVNYMMRTDINIAMVAMARFHPLATTDDSNATTHVTRSHCYVPTNDSVEVTPNVNEDGEFLWSPAIQNSIIASFHWFYILTQIVGGILAQRFGSKMVYGSAQLVCAVCSLLIPFGAGVHWSVLIVLRSIQGAASGVTWPAMYAMVGIWIPLHERSRFLSSSQGSGIGAGAIYILAGFMIPHFGWRSVFYLTGSSGLLWCVVWYIFAFDQPIEHPRISRSELEYIQKHIPSARKGMPPPWHSILTSAPAWVIGISSFGRIWARFTFLIPGLRYLQTVQGLSIQNNGIVAGAPLILSYLSSIFYCWLADKVHAKGFMTLTNIRKYNTFLSQVVPGVFLLIIGYLECELIGITVLWFTAELLTTAASAGLDANVVDIAPNLAGPVFGFAQTILTTAGFLTPVVSGAITANSERIEQWRIVFIVAAAVSCLTYIPYQIYGTAEIQDWNYPGGKPPTCPSDSTEVSGPLDSNQSNEEEFSKNVH